MTNDQPEHRPRSSLAVWLVVAALLLPIAYVLSPGPVIWLGKHGYLPAGQYLEYALWPLEKLYDNCPPVAAFYDWYFTLFGLR